MELGPIQIGDTTWYRVWPAEGGELNYSTVWWDTQDNGANPVEPGWVAAAVGSDVYLTLHEAFDPDPAATGLPPTLLVSGIGDYVSPSQDGFDLFGLAWAYLIDEQLAPCDFTVSLEPVGGGEGVVAVDSSTIGAFEEGFASVEREGFEPYKVIVSSDCEWSLRLEPFGHD